MIPSLGIIAHRGANREAPENTIAAFSRALEIGVQGIELDVHASRDGVAVVHHDPALRDGSPRLMSQLKLGSLRAAGIATLEEVLGLVDRRCRVYVEIKAAAAVGTVVELLRSRTDWCAVHSFDHRVALRARTLLPTLDVGILLVSYLVDIAAAMRAASAADVWQQEAFIDQALVDRVHGAGGRVIAWTVNDALRARALMAMGVDGICTDTPRELQLAVRDAPS